MNIPSFAQALSHERECRYSVQQHDHKRDIAFIQRFQKQHLLSTNYELFIYVLIKTSAFEMHA